LAHANARYIQGFGGLTTVNTPSPPNGNPLAQTLTSLRSGVLDSVINMDFLIQFLRKNTDARVLAEPQINIRDNETGRLFVGQQVPTLTAQVNPALGGTSQNFVYKDVGVILEVTPHINNSGDVELKVHAESSTTVPGVTILGGAVFDTRNFRTDLTAKNGQTLVLGGIIQKQVSDSLRKTPFFGSIPVLGWAFKKKDKDSHEVELMVFMRPKVTRSPEEAQDLLQEIYQRAPNVKRWKDELHPEQPQDMPKETPSK
jgi:general secretion pathway protein D